ncbi:hypothetical protein D9M71_300220 [compost metagenome]
MVGAAEAAQRVVQVLVHFRRVAAQPVEGRAVGLEGLVEGAEREELDQRAAAFLALAPALEAGHQCGQLVQRHGLVVGAGQDGALQAAAVLHQVGLADVAAHAVAQQEDGGMRVLLADVMVEAGQVADDLVPAVLRGVQAEDAMLGAAAVAALVQCVELEAGGHQRLAQPRIAAAMLGHAVGEHDHRPRRGFAGPVVDVQGHCVAGFEPEGIVAHGRSFCRGVGALCTGAGVAQSLLSRARRYGVRGCAGTRRWPTDREGRAHRSAPSPVVRGAVR